MKPPSFLIQTFGCRVNQAESKKIQEELINKGFIPFDTKNKTAPDLIILNTCAVTKKAEHEARQAINHFERTFPKAFLVATGCAVEAQKKLGIKLPAADLFIGNLDKEKIPQIIASCFPHFPEKKKTFQNKEAPVREWVKIQDGCRQYCSFCIVPLLRPNFQSKPPKEIIKEINRLVGRGVQEVVLCGINLSAFGQDLKPNLNLNDLINLILTKTKIPRLSLSSLTPNLITPSLIETYLKDHQQEKRLSIYFHLALQTGSPRLHRLMNRPKTDLNKTKKLLQYIKQEIPEFNLRADILVGFPGETEKDFRQTLQYIEEARIAFVHTFRFSPRPGTAAERMIEKGLWKEIPPEIKKERSRKVRALTKKIRQEEGKKLVGKKLNCLILGKKEGVWQGLTENFWEIEINASQKLVPKIIPVKITGLISDKKLRGKLLLKKSDKDFSHFLNQELRKNQDKKFAQSRNKLIGEKIISYGVRTKEIRKIVKKYWKEYPQLKTTAVCFTTAEKLISTKNLDNQLAGVFLLGLYQKISAIKDISWLEKLITKNINNWAVSDAFGSEVLAPVLKNSPKKNNLLYDWLNSENIWLKRAALVTTVKLKNKVENWEELAFKMLSLAEKEKEPLIKKASHWLEKAITITP